MTYEQTRLERILENKQVLLSLGLISDLKTQDGDNDDMYCQTLFSMAPIMDSKYLSKLYMVVLPHIHIPSTAILKDDAWVNRYRSFLLEQATDAYNKLLMGGLLVIGIKDCRVALGPAKKHGVFLNYFLIL